jgi:hypothetical protein
MAINRQDAIDPVSATSRRPLRWPRSAVFAILGAVAGSLVLFLLSHGNIVVALAYGGCYILGWTVAIGARSIVRRARPRHRPPWFLR